MQALDSILFTLLIWGAYIGFRRGFVVEVFSFASLGIATAGSIKLKSQLIKLCIHWYGSRINTLDQYALSTFLAIIIVIAVTLTGRFFSYLISLSLLGDLDKALGVLLGIFKWALFASTFFWLASLIHLEIPEAYTANSVLFPLIKPIAPKLVTWILAHLPATITKPKEE